MKTEILYNEKNEAIDFCSGIIVNTRVRIYAMENLILGKIGIKEKIPYDKYIEELGLNDFRQYLVKRELPNFNKLGDNEKSVYDGFECICKKFYRYVTRLAFIETMISNRKYVKAKVNKFLEELYMLFYQIICVDIKNSNGFAQEHLLNNELSRVKVTKLLSQILIGNLKLGDYADDYLGDMNDIPIYIDKLIKTHDGHYILNNCNVDDIDFKLAVISSFKFSTSHNNELYIKKIMEWERVLKCKSNL